MTTMNTLDERLLPVLSLLPLLIDIAVRSTVLLALTAAVVAVLSRRHGGGASASLRHLVWTLGLACALLLPLLSCALPGWHIALLPPAPPVTQGERAWGAAREPDLSAPVAATAPLPAAPASGSPASPASPASSASSAVRDGGNDAPRVSVGYVYLVLIWAAGALFALVKLAQAMAVLRRLERRHSVPVAEPRLLQAVAEATATMGIARPVALRQALASMPAMKVPLTYGALRPVIVLPADTADWPPERLRAALLHELAHVRRWDWVVQMLAQVVRAFYWFHPLAWLALAWVRVESENACDDLVLAAGMPARDYARHLVDVALGARDRSHNHPALTVTAAGIRTGSVAMVQTPKVEKRVRTILAPGRNRAEVTSALCAAALASAAAVLFAGAVVRLTATRAEAKFQALPPLPIAGGTRAVAVAAATATARAHRAAQAGGASREPQFPKDGRSPAGVVRLEEVVFKPIGGQNFPVATEPLLEQQVHLTPGGGELSVVQRRTNEVLWRGPVSEARFVLETVAAVHTLKHASSGRALWSDAADVAAPDLLLNKSAGGKARLLGKDGTTLWSGDLGPSPGGSSSQQRDGTLQISSSGVLITGSEGVFSVYSDPNGPARPAPMPMRPGMMRPAPVPMRPGPNARLLWSGKLPTRPTILIREGHRFHFTGPNRGESGSDRVVEVSFSAEVGQVTIADLQEKTLGTLAVDILRIKNEMRTTGQAVTTSWTVRPLTQEAELAATARGTVLLTYRDSVGDIFRRSKVYRDEKGSGTISN
jgi:beta-lactamase regulating signal transducer with metallopeptidase domain